MVSYRAKADSVLFSANGSYSVDLVLFSIAEAAVVSFSVFFCSSTAISNRPSLHHHCLHWPFVTVTFHFFFFSIFTSERGETTIHDPRSSGPVKRPPHSANVLSPSLSLTCLAVDSFDSSPLPSPLSFRALIWPFNRPMMKDEWSRS